MSAFFEKLTAKAKSYKTRSLVVSVLCIAMASVMTGITFATNAVYIKDGKDVTLVYTTDNDIDDILASQGITIGQNDEVVFTGFKNNSCSVSINRAFNVLVSADGQTHVVTMTGGTVGDALKKADVTLDNDDLINVSLDEQVQPNTSVSINRVDYRTVSKTISVPFGVSEKKTSLLKRGATSLLFPGEEGKMVSTMVERLVDGKVVSTELKEKKITKKPKNQVVLVGNSPQTPVSKLAPDSFMLNDNGVPKSFKKVLSGRATAYSARPGAGTASGRRAKVGHVAVNPNVIPYGTKLYIASPDNSYVYGYAIAADTGGALMSGKALVDLYFDTYEQSCEFGVKNLNVYILN